MTDRLSPTANRDSISKQVEEIHDYIFRVGPPFTTGPPLRALTSLERTLKEQEAELQRILRVPVPSAQSYTSRIAELEEELAGWKRTAEVNVAMVSEFKAENTRLTGELERIAEPEEASYLLLMDIARAAIAQLSEEEK